MLIPALPLPPVRSQVVTWAMRVVGKEEAADAVLYAKSLQTVTESEAKKEAVRLREQLGREKLTRTKAERRGG